MVEITHAQGFSECKKDSMPKKCLLWNFLMDKKVKARTESYERVVTGMIEYHRTIDPLHYIQLIEINLCS